MRALWLTCLMAYLAFPALTYGSTIPRFVFVDGSRRFAERVDCRSRERGPGFSIAVSHDGETLFRRDCGLADVRTGRPIDDDTRFHAAGLSRSFTAAAVLMLFEDGQIALGDPLSDYFPQLPDWSERVRLMHVLNHTDGLPDFRGASAGEADRPRDGAWVLRFLARQRDLHFEPGTAFDRNDSGYVLLAELVRRVSGVSLAEFVEKQILRPLEMDQTSVVGDHVLDVPNRALGYPASAGAPDAATPHTPGVSGIYTTVSDLQRWYLGLVENRVLAASTLEIMFHRPLTSAGGIGPWGMGWSERTVGESTPRYAGLRAFGEVDEHGGFAAYLTFYPDEKLCIILLGNSGGLPDFLDDALSHFLIRVPERDRTRLKEPLFAPLSNGS